MTTNGSSRLRAGTAIIAAVASAAVTWMAATSIRTTQAQTEAAPTRRIELMKQPLADISGREVRMLALDLAPGSGSPPHRHPGHHVFGYIVEGTYEWKINDEPAKIFKPGEVFYEQPGVLHAISRNASTTDRARLVVFMVADQSQPSTVVEPEKK
jgi:quercetin dioxygenase-like cupin family protein